MWAQCNVGLGVADLEAVAEHRIDSEESLRQLYGEPHALAEKKSLPEPDVYCREYISRSPFLCLSTQHSDGSADVSPRGDHLSLLSYVLSAPPS